MKTILAYASIILALAGQAVAADLYTPEPVQPAPVEAAPISTGGWYIRGDASFDVMDLRGAKFFQGGSSAKMVNFNSSDVDNSGNIGVGAGYQIDDHVRVDATLDYLFKADFRGSTTGGGSDFGACTDSCKSKDVTAVTAYSLMANAYVDIAHYGVFTPYAGAGIGGTYVKWDDLKNTACSATDQSDCDDTVTHKGKGSWRFTYGLMLGTAIDINCNLKADVGYRYRRVAAGEMFGFKENGGPGRDKGFNIHEGRVGLRYAFDGCSDQTAYMPPVDLPQQPQPVFK
jgi:opacity protein-like surface antigen